MRDAGAGEAGPCGSVRRVGRGAGWPGYGQGWPVAKCGQLSLCRTLPFLVGPCDVRLSTFAERPGSNLQSICWVRPSAGGPVRWGRWCSVVWAWAAGRRIQSHYDSSSRSLEVILFNAPGAVLAALEPEGPVCVERAVWVLQVHTVCGRRMLVRVRAASTGPAVLHVGCGSGAGGERTVPGRIAPGTRVRGGCGNSLLGACV